MYKMKKLLLILLFIPLFSFSQDKVKFVASGLTCSMCSRAVYKSLQSDKDIIKIESNLETHRDAMFAGESINSTEDRAVLHAALRAGPEDANTPQEYSLFTISQPVIPKLRPAKNQNKPFITTLPQNKITFQFVQHPLS